MACSKYISTRETTNAARVSRLLLDPCTDLFRDILRNHIPETLFSGTLQQEKGVLFPLLHKVHREKLYPKSGYFNGTYGEFDLSLLYILLRNLSGIPPHQKGWAKSPDPSDRSVSANIDRIREIRNTYCGHAVRVSLCDSEFQKLWKELAIMIGELEGSLPGGCTTYTNAAKMIKYDTMDPEQEKTFLDIIDQQNQNVQDLKEVTGVLKEEQEMLKSKIKQERKRRKTEQIKQQKEVFELENIQINQGTEISKLKHEQKRQKFELQTQQRMQRTETLPDSERDNILATTLAVLRNKDLNKVNIRTSGVQNTVEKLRKSHIAILTGKAGTGKTTTAYQVMREMSDPLLEFPFTPVFIKSPEQWDKVINPAYRYIVYLDDIFGSTNQDTGAVEKWKNQFDIMFSCAKTGNIMVLFGLRKNVLDETRKRLEHAIFHDGNIIDISSEENLTMNDKVKMVEVYGDKCKFEASELPGNKFARYSEMNGLNANYKLSFAEKWEILSAKPYYGFPLTYYQFFTRQEFFQLGPSYFHRPNGSLFETIEDMRRSKSGNMIEKVKYCILCYVFIHGNIEPNSVSEALFKTIYEKLRINNILDIEIKDAINDLNGLFLSKLTTKHPYEFSHETILETVLVSFGQLAPEIVIKRCSREKLHELIRSQNYDTKPCEVVLKIPKANYEDLTQRLLRDDDGDGEAIQDTFQVAVDIVRHPACEDPGFVSFFCNRGVSDRLYTVYRILCRRIVVTSLGHEIVFRELLGRFGPHQENSIQQMDESNFKISIKRIKKVLSCNFNRRNALRIIVPYICKYRNRPKILSLLRLTTYAGLSILHFCVLHGFEDLVDMILEILTPTVTVDNWSCVHLAAYAGRSSILQKLINLGHDITKRTVDGNSVLQTALLGLRYGAQDVIFPSSLKDNYDYCDSLFRNVSVSFPGSNGFKSILEDLLTKAPEVYESDLYMAVDKYNNNVMHYLVMHNYGDILRCLLKYDKMLVFQRNSSDLPTTLHVAVYLGRPEMVKKLWEEGVRPDNSDLPLMETFNKGSYFTNRVVIFGQRVDVLKEINDEIYIKECADVKDNGVFDMKLKAIREVNVIFGRIEEFQSVLSFLQEKIMKMEL
ncbi:uncharacterized protein LOC134254978 [Saccostrea cucullata]|uniref:uncharacterized protein LOC134254978 n=1 Tax=Saccostrea cuccullata TaxID=36930 RepID=UPI002ED148C3